MGVLVNPLTDREMAVLRLVARGDQNADIAAALGISVSTVRAHLHSLMLKLQSSNRVTAAAIAEERGWLHTTGGA